MNSHPDVRVIKTPPPTKNCRITWTRWEVDAHTQRPTGGTLTFSEVWPAHTVDTAEAVWYEEYEEAAERGDAVLLSVVEELPGRVYNPASWEG